MFKGCHVPTEVILETVQYYHAYKLSYRDIEARQLKRGVVIDHATINRWVIKFTPILEHNLRRKKKSVTGKRFYYYRAVDNFGDVIDYYLCLNRDESAEKAFLNNTIAKNGLLNRMVIDGRKNNHAAIDVMNVQLWLSGFLCSH